MKIDDLSLLRPRTWRKWKPTRLRNFWLGHQNIKRSWGFMEVSSSWISCFFPMKGPLRGLWQGVRLYFLMKLVSSCWHLLYNHNGHEKEKINKDKKSICIWTLQRNHFRFLFFNSYHLLSSTLMPSSMLKYKVRWIYYWRRSRFGFVSALALYTFVRFWANLSRLECCLRLSFECPLALLCSQAALESENIFYKGGEMCP